MLAIARDRAAELGREVDLREGDAQALDFADESFDSVVITLALCTIPDDRKAVQEAMRVLRPGGHLILLEHVRSPLLPVRAIQRLVEPLTIRFEADHLTRDPLDYLTEEGFAVEQVERLRLGWVERVIARKPALAQ
jgi:ubiquinone/menaquinone biosynthesis C-methylase UbiE